ncbi:MAG: nitroreductase family protein [Dehalococcoidales bacterium]|nr:nitroreductase family protein [Dehalococcoidales bacterium]
MELFEAIKTRRSIRQYTDAPVDDARINAILEAGQWAPSWANTQCWKFVVVRDPEVKARVADTLMKIKLPDRVVDNPGTKAINTVPVLIAVCGETGVSGGKPGGGGDFEYVTDKGDWFMFDTALAVQNMCLAAHAQGLGTVIIGAFDAEAAEKALDMPGGTRVVILIPVGVPAKEGNAPPRKDLSEIVINDKWAT